MDKYEFSEDPAVSAWSETMQRQSQMLLDNYPAPSRRLRDSINRLEGGGIAEPLGDLLVQIEQMMLGRHEKYGPGNIAEFGPVGILVRMADKFARLKAGQQNFDDETVRDTLSDICGYALIWMLWLDGQWPGSVEPKDNTA